MRVAVIVLLLARVRFPQSKFIAEEIWARYNENIVKRIEKLEKLDKCLRKAELDLECVYKCNNNNIVSTFLNFCLANNHLKYYFISKQCKSDLLREEIGHKKSTAQNLQKEFSSLKKVVS